LRERRQSREAQKNEGEYTWFAVHMVAKNTSRSTGLANCYVGENLTLPVTGRHADEAEKRCPVWVWGWRLTIR
jgi:hypothetical protein